MRSDPSDYHLVAPDSLQAAVSLLAEDPGGWLPIAGGTDVMVQYAAGNLSSRKLLSIWNLPELRQIEVLPNEIHIGAGCTYADLRKHEVVRRELPLLARAARWTGGIANQNRGTIGGNIVNASPAADSLPALLVYDAVASLNSLNSQLSVLADVIGSNTSKANSAPEPGAKATTWPRRTRPGKVSTRTCAGCPAAMWVSCVSLKLAITHTCGSGVSVLTWPPAPTSCPACTWR